MIDHHIFICPDGDISAWVKLHRFLGVDMAKSFLLLIVRKLDREISYPLLDLWLIGIDHTIGKEIRMRNIGGHKFIELMCAGLLILVV